MKCEETLSPLQWSVLRIKATDSFKRNMQFHLMTEGGIYLNKMSTESPAPCSWHSLSIFNIYSCVIDTRSYPCFIVDETGAQRGKVICSITGGKGAWN